jgi:nucleoside-diphosphate-sugar epimerase
MSNDQVYVITGATGWLGRECLDHLVTRGVTKDNIYLFASKQKILEMPFGSFHVHALDTINSFIFVSPIVFHFAYLTRDKVKILGRSHYTDTCLKITATITEALIKWKNFILCYASSGAVYDNQYKADSYENNPYGFLKFMDEFYFKELCHRSNGRLIIPRIFNITGKHTQNRNHYALTSFVDQANQSGLIQINAKHEVIRSYISAQQLIRICLKWMNDKDPFLCFDACSDEVVEIINIAKIIQKKTAGNIEIHREIDDSLTADVYLGNFKDMDALCTKYKINLLSLAEQIEKL